MFCGVISSFGGACTPLRVPMCHLLPKPPELLRGLGRICCFASGILEIVIKDECKEMQRSATKKLILQIFSPTWVKSHAHVNAARALPTEGGRHRARSRLYQVLFHRAGSSEIPVSPPSSASVNRDSELNDRLQPHF